MAGVELSDFMIDIGPEGWASDFRSIKARLVVADTFKDPLVVLKELMDFVESAHRPGMEPTVSLTASALAKLQQSVALHVIDRGRNSGRVDRLR